MLNIEAEITADDFKYLKLLAKQYPNITSASTEIINLQAILNLPKGTEHFISDIHGEYESFSHVLRNASGVIKNHITYIFGTSLRDSEKKTLATLIYYPEQKLEEIKKTESDMNDWYKITLHRLVTICKVMSAKYTRSKVRKALPQDFAYIIEELLHEDSTGDDKELYYNQIIESIVRLDQADRFITAISHLIQRLAIDRLHVIGDIYDRGPNAAKIMDILENYHSIDVQWGNHDISWMGAAAGCQALICNVIRIQARYCNLDTVEEAYGINLIPLATFAMEKYADDPCTYFLPKNSDADMLTDKEVQLTAKMHKAISIMQFKMEAQIIKRHPEFGMEGRLLLDKIDFEKGTINIKGVDYPMLDMNFPTIDPKDPFSLSEEEQDVMDKIKSSFVNSGDLQRHVRFLLSNGSIYNIFNSNLLYHGCIPLNADGSLKEVNFRGKRLKGKDYLDAVERVMREGYYTIPHSETKRECLDLMWYLWCGENSPLFGKDAMTTFERYFIEDKATHVENKSPYYERRDEESVCRAILENFGLNPDKSHIINGHVPVKVKKGESPIKANGKLFVIDGGFAKAYQKETGIAGYTLIYNSHGLVLVSHEPFESREKAIAEEKDIHSSTVALQYSQARIMVSNTDIGAELKKNISELDKLVSAYRSGLIKEIK
ncbi:fructose-1,6-bisphosphatase [Anaerotignum sp. MSJ-24]|uniref:fructose-1,6-bisphosphatase n=1 Tax=Anaerotignum sp. MSJ-24 TaxID=2841521 RepID=UPI001C120DDE|nr:fructose-1,6-bisphosphatase [Anaerotignum sp. MSJ-24]MBU5464382.1 fructose-1,6-bisphosphatase [Anaerotignum sp. MSJ-24]